MTILRWAAAIAITLAIVLVPALLNLVVPQWSLWLCVALGGFVVGAFTVSWLSGDAPVDTDDTEA